MIEPSVYGNRCSACGKVSYPTHCVCPECGEGAFEPVELAGEGTVLTYTDVYALPLDYAQRYLRLGMVELDLGVRATGQLLDENPEIGKRVKVTIGVVRQSSDKQIYGLQFVPV
jgi:uncharacterized OB-fold protein